MTSVEGAFLGASLALLFGSLMPLLRDAWRAGLWLQALALLAFGSAALPLLIGGEAVGSGWTTGLSPALGLDGLSAFFAITLTVTGVPALVFATRYLGGGATRPVASLSGLFVAAMLLVLAARDVSTFLAGWELMTLIPATAMLLAQPARRVRRATFAYLAITHLGGVGVWVAMLLLASIGGLADPGAAAARGGAFMVAVWIAALVGFGTKAGLMPMHSWLPRAHPVAPAHISALMSGVMIKVALYGLVRVLFYWTPEVPAWLALAVVVLGALSAAGGVLYALFQHELKRLLAFHSIENVGIITLGLGASLMLAGAGSRQWAAIAFGAAMLHTLNHAVFKGLLFLAAGAFERATGAHHIDHMGGLLRLMPWTGAAFLTGSMAIAGMPPLNGFASEWLTFQSLLHAGYGPGAQAAAGPLAAAALAATAGMAVLCFAKVSGLVLLGRPRGRAVAAAVEAPGPMRVATVALAAACVVLGVVAGLLLPALAGLRGTGLGADPSLALPGTGALPTPALAVAVAGGCGLLWLATRRRAAAPAPAWTSGQDVEPVLQWTSSAFTKPLRLSFEDVIRPVREIQVHAAGGLVRSVTYRGHVPHLFDTAFYRPVVRRSLRLARAARRLQSGSLRSYALYLGASLGVLLLATRLGWLQ